MKIMAESCIGIKIYILHHMTLPAVTFYAESRFAVMASAAGYPPFHLPHGYMGITARLEQLCMAVGAGKESQMELVTEQGKTEIRDID
jgi:hypothetical protein